MSNRREHRKINYNNLYKKYSNLLKKNVKLRDGNRLLQSTNNEIFKGIVGLKKEMKKCMLINSNLKAEIYDLTMDKKDLMDDNKGLYNTLTSLRIDTEALQNRISRILESVDPESLSFSMPQVNGQVIKNPKDNSQLLPETNYQRYNFKDFIYVQDLSPIMEENAEVKHLIKPSDITRRLGHRTKVPHPNKGSESLEVSASAVEEVIEIDLVDSSPSPVMIQDDDNVEDPNVEEQSVIVDDRTKPVGACNATEISPRCCKSNRTADESVLSSSSPSQHAVFNNENDGVLSPSVSVVLPSDCENSLNEKEFGSSLFAYVFPRRRMINNGYSLSLGNVEDKGNEELNSSNDEKENVTPKVSTKSLKGDLSHSEVVDTRSESPLKNNSTISLENVSKVAPESSHKEESIIEDTCAHIEHNIEDIVTGSNACTESFTETYSLVETNVEQSAQEQLRSSSKLIEDAIIDVIEVSSSSIKRTPDKSSKKSSTLNSPSKSVKEKKSDVKQLSRSADRNSAKSPKCGVTPGRKSLTREEDSKKSLRPKKPLNFAESPVGKITQKRKRKLVKATK